MKWTNAKAVGANIPSRPRRCIPAQEGGNMARGVLWGLVLVTPFWLIICIGIVAYVWTR